MVIQDATAPAISAGDTAWVMISTGLVLLMVPGLALFYGGLVRARAALNTFMMSFAALAVILVQWVLVGYSMAFAPGRVIGDLRWAGFRDVTAVAGPYSATIPHLSFAAFQAMFAGITFALISGAIVERIRFRVYLVLAVVWSTIVYAPLAHWVWATDGWIRALGALDFAGGTVVHVSAGTAALVAALMIGRRRDLRRTALVPHNVPFTILGAGMLWFGWIGFNAGSALAADGVAANALVTTVTAAATAFVAWMVLDMARGGRATAVGAATGAVAGLVAITPAAGFVTPVSALAIGALGAVGSYVAIQLRSRSRIDDALDVFACHGVAGILGAVLTGVFATKSVNPLGADGLIAAGNWSLVGVQALAVLATMAFVAPVTALSLKAISLVTPLRLEVPREYTGVDLSEHSEHAYHDGEASDLAGGGVRIGEGVLLPAPQAKPARLEPRASTA
ncbi:MAG TPA: ammonium transporter [Gemmatimonadaceae bacterium]|nr:ammonium transporter [Gemmatimonadaceae bacterium]